MSEPRKLVSIECAVTPLNIIAPFPHVFSLSPFPLCAMLEGTHDDRGAGDNTQRSHRLGHFPNYVTVLCVTATQQHVTVGRYKTSSSVFDTVGALRLYTPNKHFPLISTLRMGRLRV